MFDFKIDSGSLNFSIDKKIKIWKIPNLLVSLNKKLTNYWIVIVRVIVGEIIKNYGGPEYRLGIRYVIDETLSIKAGINTQRQYIHSLSNTTAMAPTDIWKLSDINIKPRNSKAIQFKIPELNL